MDHTEIPTTALASPPKNKGGRGTHLTALEKEKIRQMYLVERMSISDIAKQLARTRETISGVVRDAETGALETQLINEQRKAAKRALETGMVSAAEAWMKALPAASKRGNHKPARDLLLHTGVVDPIERGAVGNVIVQIGVAGTLVRIGGEDDTIE
jgi:hypothetical protein